MTTRTIDAKLAGQLRELGSTDGVVQLVDESGALVGFLKASSEGGEYRPLPPFGTPEFYEEMDRRRQSPGRGYTIEESLADWNED